MRIDSQLPTLTQLLPKEASVQRQVLRGIEQIVGLRRGERVYFPLDELVKAAAVPRDAVTRALRELRKLPGFDYVPPFRGRAVHVLNRQRPFQDLNIDFVTLEKRKANEYEKLEQVVRYAVIGGCRQLEILKYFGDPNAQHCGVCDNCGHLPHIDLPPAPVAEPRDSEESVLHCVRMALSGVARTQGRVGKGLVAKMLCGSQSQQLRKLRLDQLSTFGLLSHLCQSEVTTLLDALIETKLIEQTETQRFRPTVKLTSRGQQVMTGQLQLDRPLPVSAPLRRKLQQVPASQPVTSAARGGDRVSRRGADSAPAPPAAGVDRARRSGRGCTGSGRASRLLLDVARHRHGMFTR